MRNSRRTLVAVFTTLLLSVALHESATAQRWGGGQSRWRSILDNPDDWYGSAESVRIADNVLAYQNDNGGWPKNIDMAKELKPEELADIRAKRNEYDTLIDNGATWTQIRFLALVGTAAKEQRFLDATRRGIEYLLAAQYENGGWPQFYPLRPGYYTHITFNDGAMIGVMRVLRDVADGKHPFEFVDADLRERAGHAADKGVDVILKCQVVVDGKPTVWCAQHDEKTFEPRGARSYELVSLSGDESVGIVEYLMDIDNPTPQVKLSVQAAAEWFDHAKIMGKAVKWVPEGAPRQERDRVVVDDPEGGPLWARFYEIGTNRPMYVGRDGVVHEHLADIERERRVGYVWISDWARKLLDKEYPAWCAKWGVAQASSAGTAAAAE